MNMVYKKAYIQPETKDVTIDVGNLMITASGGSGDIHFTYDDEEDNASQGMSRIDIFDSAYDFDDDLD